ncbi:MAG TPA: preprotein translocase subunit SecE [Longimicrobium sp.]|jgi:preprotein translocase SecE subunit
MAETTRTSAREFLVDVKEQVQKITWPDQEQLKSSTGVILAFVAMVALIIFGMDLAVRTVLDLVRSLFA